MVAVVRRRPTGPKPMDEDQLTSFARVEIAMRPEDRRRLKVRAAEEGVSMRAWALAAVLEKLNGR